VVRFLPRVLGSALLLLSGATAARAEYRSLETESLRLVYLHPAHGFLAEHAARCFENSLRFHRRLLDYTPSEKVTVLLDDLSDFGNAGVWTNPLNTMVVHIAPANFVYETGPGNERINFTMNHELAHIATLDQAAGPDVLFRRLFRGKVRERAEHPESMLYAHLTLPRRAAPRWHREGTAVFFETWMAGGLGRAQGPYDEMVFRAMVRDGAGFYDPLGLESEGTKVDFQIGVNAYLYGTRFTTWLAYRHGPEEVVRWVSRRPGSRAYFASQFHEVFGVPLGAAWRSWVEFEHGFQRANLDSLRRHPLTVTRDLAPQALGSVSRACLDRATGTVYVGMQHPGQVAHVVALPLRGGPPRPLKEVKGPALYFVCSLAWDEVGRKLFYTTDNDAWRDLCVLDPATGRSRVLMRDARVGDLALNRADRSLWGVRHLNGISTLVRIPPPYTDYHRVLSFPYGRDLYDLDISPDGRWLAGSLGEISGRHSLRLMSVPALLRGDTTSRSLFDFGVAIPSGFVFSDDGRYLFGTSYLTGVSNVFRYDLVADTMDVVSNAETGLFRPLPLSADSLVVFRYSGRGFVPAVMAARPLRDVSAITFLGERLVVRHPQLKGWKVPSPASIVLDSLRPREGPYRPWSGLRLVSAYPVVEAYKDQPAFGVAAVASDPASRHQVVLSATASAAGPGGEERWHLSAAYQRPDLDLVLRRNPASFYDLFGPTKTSRKGYGAALSLRRTLLRDDPRTLELRLESSAWGGLERLPDAQNVSTSPGFDKLLVQRVELRGRNLRSSLGAVDHEKGYEWSLGTAANGVRFVRGTGAVWRGYPFLEGALDAGAPLPVAHSSLWLRGAAGWSPGDRREPFARFFFGGFGNNRLDHREVKRYREPGSFPGLQLEALSGVNYARLLAEWNLPPLRFQRLGTPAFYGSWLRLSLFGAAIATDLDVGRERRELANTGTQADLRFQLFTHQPLTLSGGYARAFERGRRAAEEWMVSLKLL
jgi:hypothetical protein